MNDMRPDRLPDTPILRRAERLWAQCCVAGATVPASLVKHWHDYLPDRRLDSFDDLRAALAAPADEGVCHDLINCWRDVAGSLGRRRARAADEQVQLVLALLLLAFERHAQSCVAAHHTPVTAWAGRLQHCSDKTAAEVLAACLTRSGLLLEPDAAGSGGRAVNVIDDLPPIEYQHVSGEEALRREIDAMLAAWRDGPDSLVPLSRRREQARGAQRATRTHGHVMSNLRQFRNKENVNAMVVVPAAGAPAALQDEAVRRYAEDDLGVPCVEFGPTSPAAQPAAAPAAAGPAAGADDAWRGAMADITETFREALDALFGESPSRQAAASGTRPAPLVFISYSHHDDDHDGVERVWTTLRALELAGSLRLWIDRRDIPAGARFDDVIRRNIADASLALVLVSPTLISSEYVLDQELPAILQRVDSAASPPLVYFPFLLRQCGFDVLKAFKGRSFKLGTAQALGDCADEGPRDQLLKRLFEAVLEALEGRRSVQATTLKA